MGINRITIACNVCQEVFSLRVAVSIGKQRHQFNCLKCESSLCYSYYMKPDMGPGGSQSFEGCKEAPFDIDAAVINLHPEIPIPRGELSNPRFSANIHLLQLAGDKLGDQIDGVADAEMLALNWDEIRVLWDLYRNGKTDVLATKLNVPAEAKKVREAFFNLLLNFTSHLHLDKSSTPVGEDFSKFIEEILNTNEPELRRFCVYYRDNLFSKNLEFYRTALDTIFGAWQDIKQVRLLNKLGVDDMEYVISSIHFDSTKKVYGDLFEILDKTFNFVPLIVRLKTEGQFDRFSNTDLDTYLKTSLQNKIQFIPSKSELSTPDDQITNNKIRNSSHHNTIRIDLRTQIVHCEDREAVIELTYLDYLHKCTKLANYLVGQFILELEFWHFSQQA